MPAVSGMRPVREWIALCDDDAGPIHAAMTDIYADAALVPEPVALLRRTLEEFARVFDEGRDVFVVRSTGRINLLGMHVDHRGGSVNPVAIKEAFFVVEPRDDDRVECHDVNGERFPPESFSIGDCLPDGEKIADWDAWCHEELQKRSGDGSITFSNYIRAGVLYFQHLNTADDGTFSPAFRGMNMMIGSNVPPAAGLSTSSCLVVAAGMAALRINGVEMDPMEFSEQCGFAEWYVGTRGGFGDHAAIRLGEPNTIVHMTSFPFSLRKIPFPAGYRVVMADSQVEAKKQEGAKDGYNFPLAAYQIGLHLIKKNRPADADRIEHLRDINPDTLGCDDAEIFRILKSLPETLTREEAFELLPEQREYLETLFRSHNPPPDGYTVRQVCMYGVSECLRSTTVGPAMLEQGDIAGFGECMTLHHDGDRVMQLIDDEMRPFDNSYPDDRMDFLITEADSGVPERVEAARVWRQSGGYRVSVPEIDMMVDFALEVPGVMGAGLVGAGLGGSMIALVEADHADEVVDTLVSRYFEPKGLTPKVEVVAPVGGACILEV